MRATVRAAAAQLALLLAGCASVPRAPEPAVTWRVVSYNIRHGRGVDDRVDLERTAAVLRRLDADVIALQEVDERVERSGGVDQAARLGELLGMRAAFGAFMPYQGGRYGLAVLTRCAIGDTDVIRLPDGNEPRVALAVTLRPRAGPPVTLVNVHFDWVQDDAFRYAQAETTATQLDALSGPWIIAGDFNDRPGARTLDLFHARAAEAAKPAGANFTFPSDEPAREIDFIFAAPHAAWRIATAEVVTETVASDHRPVVAELVSGGVIGPDARRACR